MQPCREAEVQENGAARGSRSWGRPHASVDGLKLPLERKISSNLFTFLSQEMAIKILPHSALEVSCLSPCRRVVADPCRIIPTYTTVLQKNSTSKNSWSHPARLTDYNYWNKMSKLDFQSAEHVQSTFPTNFQFEFSRIQPISASKVTFTLNQDCSSHFVCKDLILVRKVSLELFQAHTQLQRLINAIWWSFSHLDGKQEL